MITCGGGLGPPLVARRRRSRSADTVARLLFVHRFIKFVFALKVILSIRNVALLFFCAIAGAAAQTPPPEKAIVYAVHDPNAIAEYKINQRAVRGMVDRLIL